MKTLILTLLIIFQYNLSFSQKVVSNPSESNEDILKSYTDVFSKKEAAKGENIISAEKMGANGFDFAMVDVGLNSKFSEYSSGYFRNKFILVSSKKIGGLDKIDKNTNEAYKNLFCADIKKDGDLKKPLLFSRILNSLQSEDQVSFSPDEHTIYFTRSDKKNSLKYTLLKAELAKKSHGNWTNIVTLLEDEKHSYENPFVSPDGRKLYFSSNKSGGYGGYDLYVSNLRVDGTLEAPQNLGSTINTAKDEKYPSLSFDGKKLYFSSNGHKTIGGLDVLYSKIIRGEFKKPLNLGNTINTPSDEVAFYLSKNNKTGYVSSNPNGKFDIQKFDFKVLDIIQYLEGTVVDVKTNTPLTNATVSILDEKGNEIDMTVTGNDGIYKLNVEPSSTYTITTKKDGFENNSFNFVANKSTQDAVYTKKLELAGSAPIIKVVGNNKRVISVENIYFDYNKWSIKNEAQIALDKIHFVLSDNPDMNIRINAHTDNVGSAKYNQELSDKRAKSAKAYLVAKGISSERITTIGFGESDPLIDCGSKCKIDDNIANRRIEFQVLN